MGLEYEGQDNPAAQVPGLVQKTAAGDEAGGRVGEVSDAHRTNLFLRQSVGGRGNGPEAAYDVANLWRIGV